MQKTARACVTRHDFQRGLPREHCFLRRPLARGLRLPPSANLPLVHAMTSQANVVSMWCPRQPDFPCISRPLSLSPFRCLQSTLHHSHVILPSNSIYTFCFRFNVFYPLVSDIHLLALFFSRSFPYIHSWLLFILPSRGYKY